MAPSAVTSPRAGLDGQITDEIAALNGQQDGTNLLSHAMHGLSNGSTDIHTQPLLSQSAPTELLDLICVGFGPASLAIAIALHDATKSFPNPSASHRVLFLEKQPRFAWHAGMQLSGAKMQISFLKDLATPRDPTSRFTFLNYLFEKGRLSHFINLGTFLPSRIEYEDYLRWCASFFEREGKVEYGMEVEGVGVHEKNAEGKVTSFEVTAKTENGKVVTRRAQHVVIAVGGRPITPPNLHGLKQVTHSSQYASTISRIQEIKDANRINKPLRFAVLGGGQSAAEIFNDLTSRFTDAKVSLIIKGASLRPSDDSPFVNEIFDPDRVDTIYDANPSSRAASISLDRSTNYGVVRLDLLEHLYEKLYMQRLHNPDETQWRCRILPKRSVISAHSNTDSSLLLRLSLLDEGRQNSADVSLEEEIEVDHVFTATGYRRDAHEEILEGVKELLPDTLVKEGGFPVKRDYGVEFDETKVDGRAGVWLQGCNEATHGLSDTLLSILAVRGGELVDSIFGYKK